MNKLQADNDLKNTRKIKKFPRGEIPYQPRTDRLKTDNSQTHLRNFDLVINENLGDSSPISMTHGTEQADNTVKVSQLAQNIASNKLENPKGLKFQRIYKTPLKNLTKLPERNPQKDF